LLENAKGCVWNCTVQNAEEARLLEANYSISSKQYVENEWKTAQFYPLKNQPKDCGS